MFQNTERNMKPISQIIIDNNTAVKQMKLIYQIWYSSVIEDIKNISTPYEYNPYEKKLVVLVHDNIWYSEMRYMEEDFIELLNKNNLEIKKIVFKYKPKYEKVEKNTLINYTITKQAENFINASACKFNNTTMEEYFRQYLTNFFHYTNFNQWIIKG